MGAPQSGADIYRDGKKMRAAPKERTRKEYGRRLTAGGNARAPQSGAEAEPPQSGGHIGKGIWTAQQRRDIFGMGPLANRRRIPNLKESGSGSSLPYTAKCILLHTALRC